MTVPEWISLIGALITLVATAATMWATISTRKYSRRAKAALERMDKG